MSISQIPARVLGVEPPKPNLVARSPFPSPESNSLQVADSINHYEDLIHLLSDTLLSPSSKKAELSGLLKKINDEECSRIFNNKDYFNQLKKLEHNFAVVVATRSEQFRISKTQH